MRVTILSFGAVMILTGCHPTRTINGIEVYEMYWNPVVDSLTARARAEFPCPTGELKFELFQRRGKQPTDVGVTGCGKYARYERTVRGPWVVSGPWELAQKAAPAMPAKPNAAPPPSAPSPTPERAPALPPVGENTVAPMPQSEF